MREFVSSKRIFGILGLVILVIIAAPLLSDFPFEQALQIDVIPEADAAKSVGKSTKQYGFATKRTVCGDRLCSELEDDTSRGADDFFDEDTSRGGFEDEAGPFYNDNYDNHPSTRTEYKLVSLSPMYNMVPTIDPTSGCKQESTEDTLFYRAVLDAEGKTIPEEWWGETCVEDSKHQLAIYKQNKPIGTTHIIQCGVTKTVTTWETESISENYETTRTEGRTHSWESGREASHTVGGSRSVAETDTETIGGEVTASGKIFGIGAEAKASYENTHSRTETTESHYENTVSNTFSQAVENSLETSVSFGKEVAVEKGEEISTDVPVAEDEQLKWTPFQGVYFAKVDVWKAGENALNVNAYVEEPKYLFSQSCNIDEEVTSTILGSPNPSRHFTGDGICRDIVAGASCTKRGTPKFGEGVKGDAFYFNGDVDPSSGFKINVGGIDYIEPLVYPPELTITAWVNTDYDWSPCGYPYGCGKTFDHQTIISSWDGVFDNNFFRFQLYANTNSPTWSLWAEMMTPQEGIGATAGQIIDNTWNHVAMVHDGSKLQLYINGHGVEEDGWGGGTPVIGFADTYIGRTAQTSNGYPFVGKIDDIQVFDRALTPTEIRAVMNPAFREYDCSPNSLDLKALEYDLENEGYFDVIFGSVYGAPEVNAKTFEIPFGAEAAMVAPPGNDVSGNGRIYDNVGKAIFCHKSTGPHIVLGTIYGDYKNMGGPWSSNLGFPTTDELSIPNQGGQASLDDANSYGRYSNFQNGVKCWVYDEPGIPVYYGKFGPEACYPQFEIAPPLFFPDNSLIFKEWKSLGGINSGFGRVTSDEFWHYDGDIRFNNFEGGTICWNEDTKQITPIYGGQGPNDCPGFNKVLSCSDNNEEPLEQFPNHEIATKLTTIDYQTWGVENPNFLKTITTPDKLKFVKNIDEGKEIKWEVIPSVEGVGYVQYEYLRTEDTTTQYQNYHPAFCDDTNECNFSVVYAALNSGKNNLYAHNTMVQPIPTYEIHDDVITTKWQCGAGLRALGLENLAYSAANSKLKIHMVPSKDNVQIIVTDSDNYAIKDVKVSVDPFSFPIIERGSVCLKKGQVDITDEYGSVDFYIPDQSISDVELGDPLLPFLPPCCSQ